MALSTQGDAEKDPPSQEGGTDGAETKKETIPPRQVNKAALAIVGALVLTVVAAAGTFSFVESERQRDIQAWQVRLGIVADSRSAAADEWVEQNFGYVRELAQNASLQVYMSELAAGGAEEEQPPPGLGPGPGAEGIGEGADEAAGGFPEDDEGGEAASASFLRNLLIATAERTGFKAPPPVGEVAANVAAGRRRRPRPGRQGRQGHRQHAGHAASDQQDPHRRRPGPRR